MRRIDQHPHLLPPTPGQSAASPRAVRRLRNRAGYALPAALLFLMLAFGAWAVLFRTCASVIRVEQARCLRDTRSTWSAPAAATALRLLQTSTPAVDPYTCKLTITQDSQTRYFLLTFEKITPTRWTVTAAPTTADEDAPDCPTHF